jgi:hypothetical protein
MADGRQRSEDAQQEDVPVTVALPADAPVLNPGAARALLRLIRNVHQQHHDQESLPTPSPIGKETLGKDAA